MRGDASEDWYRGVLASTATLLCFCSLLMPPGCVTQAAAQQQEPSQQSQGPVAGKAPQEPAREMAVKEEATSVVAGAARFRVNVKLVLVRVVVRDQNSRAIGDLHKEDFEIFDNGKLQEISDFDVERAEAAPTSAPGPGSVQSAVKPEFPVRFVAYLFDDIHISFQDLASVRSAAHHRVDALPSTDRAAIFSTSGQTMLDFTDDRAKLHETLNKLLPHPIAGGSVAPCPPISFYQADQIVNKKNPDALQVAVNDYILCTNLPQTPQAVETAGKIVEGISSGVLTAGEYESRLTLGVIQDTIRRIMSMPGQRSIVLISPGFLTPDLEFENYDIVDRALRAQVVINSLDARGLSAPIPGGDVSYGGSMDQNSMIMQGRFEQEQELMQQEVLSVLSYGTGGNFFHNNNDMDEGLRRLGESPEYYYILGFTPQGLKTDGKFHTLKVTLKSKLKYDLQARRGYYAPRKADDPAEDAKREIDDAVLSSEELHDLPVSVHTQFFRAADDSVKLTVVARIDVQHLHYKQMDDRNQNDLTIVTAVFDRNGNIIQANQKLLQLRWKNETLQTKLSSGVTVRSSFDVKPGRYRVRVVARDSEQQLMSAENGAVEIP